jgi:hypothetical protein
MAKKSKGKLQTRKDKRRAAARREERRFVSQSSANPTALRVLGALSAAILGAGAWGYVYGQSFTAEDALKAVPSYLVAVGAVLLGATIWIGTSTEATVRVGDPGLAVEKGELRRMPWWCIDKITFDAATIALIVAGKDEIGVDWTIKLPVRRHPDAVGWLMREALDRIPRRVDIDESMQDKLPRATEGAGEKVELEALQVVGKRCAASGKIISYEPDGCVCARCERVYVRTAVPKKCKCGNSLLHLRKGGEGTDEGAGVDSMEAENDDVDSASDDDDEHRHDEAEGEKRVQTAES